ncbi:MAG: chorismate lyase [Candidatus Manganitrophaceae bacterium]
MSVDEEIGKIDWITKETFWDDCRLKSIDPLLRLILTSDGTLVRHLRSILLSPIKIEIEDQREIFLDEEQARQIGLRAGEKGIQRKVWLTLENRPLDVAPNLPRKGEKKVFAVSAIPLSGLIPEVYREIRSGQKPLGEIIEAYQLATYRDRLEVARLPFPEIAEALGRPPGELLWARRYRLTFSNGAASFIFEAFSPSLFSSS